MENKRLERERERLAELKVGISADKWARLNQDLCLDLLMHFSIGHFFLVACYFVAFEVPFVTHRGHC